MSKELAKTTKGGALAVRDNPFAEAAGEMAQDGGNFMKFNAKEQAFVAGAEDDIVLSDDDLEEGKVVRMAVNMNEFTRGWLCWIDEEVKDELSRNIMDGPAIKEADLPDYDDEMGEDDGWVEVASVPMRDIETGEQYLYKASSRGANKALGKLLKVYSKQYKRHDDDEVPVVELGMESYKHKKKVYGIIFNPTFKLVEWVNADDLNAALEDDEDGYEPEDDDEEVVEKAPKKGKKSSTKKKKKEPETEEDDNSEEEAPKEEKKKRRPRREF